MTTRPLPVTITGKTSDTTFRTPRVDPSTHTMQSISYGHHEIHGKKGGGIGNRDTDEYILKQNTTYYFRLKGTVNGVDNVVASLELSWYEHTNKEV